MKLKIPIILIIAITFFFSGRLIAQSFEPNWASLDQRHVPEWFHEAKFGIFIHFGVYSVPSYRPVKSERFASYAEWYEAEVMNKPGKGMDFHNRVYGNSFEYRDFAPMLKAELFDAEQWAKIIKGSGAKYVVLTAKHHDGYCLWPTKTTNWNSTVVGPKRDIVGEVTTAVRNLDLRVGFYYSLLEWNTTPTQRNPSGFYLDKKFIDKYGMPHDKYLEEKMLPQLKELVLNYQPSLIFADGTWMVTQNSGSRKTFWLGFITIHQTKTI